MITIISVLKIQLQTKHLIKELIYVDNITQQQKQLTLNGNLATHEDMREYEHQFSKSTEIQEIETVGIHSHNINHMPQYTTTIKTRASSMN